MYRRPPGSPKWDITEADWIDHNPNPRFAIFNGGAAAGANDAVFDKETGLVWQRSPDSAKRQWDPAIYSYSQAIAGRKGWRLPAIEELLSLVDPAQNNPTLPAGHPFLNVQTDAFYWSSTLGMTSPPTYAWGWEFANADTSNCLKTSQFYLWLARGGSGHDYPF